MARLPRLPKDLSLVDVQRRVSVEFQRWWQKAMEAIENMVLDLQEAIDRITTNETDIAALEAVTFTAGNGLTGGGNILSNPAFAVGAGTGIVVGADDVSVSAKLALYHGGDTPSAFTLGIVDSVDAAAWRSAIGAGTGSGTVTSVAATVPTGFSISGSPVTGSGTLAIAYTAGYQGFTTAESVKLAGVATGATANTGTVTSAAMTVPTGFSIAGSPITTTGTFALTYAAGYQGYTTVEATKLGLITSGTYTPTLTNTTNITSSTAYTCQYMRVGDVVTVSGKIDIFPTATGPILMGISLPVASNFSAEENCGGTAQPSTSTAGDWTGAIRGDATNDRATLAGIVPTTSGTGWFFHYTYRII